MAFLKSNPDWRDPDDYLREILERQHLIDRMQKTKGWELWADFLAAEAQGYQNRLLRGSHDDLLSMKFDAGVVEGLRIALGVSETLGKRAAVQRDLLAMDALANQEDSL